MSSVEYLREFINERLTVAAEEIMGVFIKTIVEYEEEIDRQRKLLDVVWNPEINLERIELPRQHVCQDKEVLSDQQLCIQELNSSLDQEDPEPPQIKEEQEELYTSQEGEQLELKQETETFMLTPTAEETNHNDTEPNSDDQLLSHVSHVPESQDEREGTHGDPESAEPMSQKRLHKSTSHHNNLNSSNLLKIHCDTQADKTFFQCDTCGKAFKFKSHLYRHLIIHTGERPYCCNTCGKDFRSNSHLIDHMRIHTCEKPYSCKTCGKDFKSSSNLKSHIRLQALGEPHSCNTCGLSFCLASELKIHIRTHTNEKPHCKICGKDFGRNSDLNVHMRTHTGEKRYSCQTCGKYFTRSSDLSSHIRRAHTGEKPYVCKLCGKRYFDASQLSKHIRSHSDK